MTYSLSCSRDMIGAPESKRGHVTWPRPFHGFVVRKLGPAMISRCTTFEVSVSIHYKDRKGDAKSRKWEWFGLVRGSL